MRPRVTVVPTVLLAWSRREPEKRVTISPAAPAPERSTVRGRLRKRAQIKSQKTPKLNEFRGRHSQSRRTSETGFRSRSIRIAIARPSPLRFAATSLSSRSRENPSAKSVRKGCLCSPSSSPEPGLCWPPGQQMKNGGVLPAGLELSFSLTIHKTVHPMVHTARGVSHTLRPRASADPLGTSARNFQDRPGDHRAARGGTTSPEISDLSECLVSRICG